MVLFGIVALCTRRELCIGSATCASLPISGLGSGSENLASLDYWSLTCSRGFLSSASLDSFDAKVKCDLQNLLQRLNPSQAVSQKCLTGIHGLDEITLGGLPRGRPTLVCGGAGCGKTLLGMEFLVRGATQFDEPGVCLSFEETADELTSKVASLGFDLATLIKHKKLAIDHVYLERSLIEETGEYDLEALFIRLGHAVDSIGAKRVLLDSVEALFAGLEKSIGIAG